VSTLSTVINHETGCIMGPISTAHMPQNLYLLSFLLLVQEKQFRITATIPTEEDFALAMVYFEGSLAFPHTDKITANKVSQLMPLPVLGLGEGNEMMYDPIGYLEAQDRSVLPAQGHADQERVPDRADQARVRKLIRYRNAVEEASARQPVERIGRLGEIVLDDV
jgi:hypothetical protein